MILKSVNLDIADLMDEKIFEEAASNLFDCSFEKMKERVESIKLLSTSKSSCLVATSVFKNSPPERWRPSKQGEVLAEETCQ